MRYLIHILFIFLLSVSFLSNSQNTTWDWGRGASSSGEERATDVVANPLNGETYSCGYYKGDLSGQFTLGTNNTTDFSSPSGEDAYVAKYDANGVFQWAFNIDGPNNQRATGIDIDASGNIYVTGWFESVTSFSGVSTSINITKTSTNKEDVFLAKYNSNGNLIWVVHGAANDEAISRDVSVNDDGVFITGWYFNTTLGITDGLGVGNSTTLVNGGDGRDVFVAAFNFNGSQRWLRRGAGVSNSDDLSYGITANESHVYVTGVVSDNCTFFDPINGNKTIPPFVSGSNTIFMISFSENNGAISWVNRIGSTGNDNCEAHGIFSSDDKLFITGGVNDDNGALSFPGVPNTNMASSSNQEIFLCQIDTASRVTDWYNFEINDSGNDSRGEDIIVDNEGNVVVAGYCAGTTGFDTGSIVASGNYDLFISAYDSFGNGLWVESAQSTNAERATGVSFDNNSNYYISGFYRSDLNIAPQPNLIHAGSDDICLLKLNVCPGPSITSCYSDSSVTADPSCNYIIGDYTDSITVVDDCGTGVISVTQSPAPSTLLPSGEHEITMTATDGNGDTAVCTWTLTVEAPINPVVVGCGQSYLGQTTTGQGDNGSSFSCSANPTPGEDVYYQITVPSGNYLLGISLENVIDAESQIKTFWVGSGCPLGSGCIEENTFDIGSQEFTSTNQNQLLFNAAGPGTYYFVVDSELDGVDQYDILFDCISSGIEFDETGCAPDTDNDGVYTTVNGSTTLNLEPCQTGVQICNQIFVQNVNAGEWLDTVDVKLGPCYTNVTNITPNGPGSNGFYDGAGTWNAVYDGASNTIEWGFDYSGAQQWGDGSGSNFNCLSYTFCFEADITPGCNVSSDLDISIHIEDDGVNGVTSIASNGFDDAVASLNLVDPSPSITCPVNLSVNSDPGSCSAVVSGLAPTSAVDNCPSPTITYSLSGATAGSGSNDASGETFNLGITTVTYTIEDGAGNTTNCSFTVTVVDSEAPTISCPSAVSVNNASGGCTAVVNNIAPLSSGDNCSVSSIAYTLSGATTGSGSNDASGEAFNSGVTTVTYTITDDAGNTTSCSFTVTVIDNETPTISCPSAVSVYNDAGVCTAEVNNIAPISSGDNCPTPTITYTLTGATTGVGNNDASGEVFNLGVTTVTYTITDGGGNTTSCSFTVTVADNEAPTISCPSAVTVNNDAGVCTAEVNNIAPLNSGDNCSVASITFALSGATTGSGSNDASGETFNLGVTTVVYTITDGAGNTSNCSFTVTVVDSQAPTISCPSAVTVNNDAGVCTAEVNNIAPLSSGDNCSVSSIVYALTGATTGSGSNDASGETFNLGITTVTYTITDDASNTTNCSFTVTIVDGEAPTISCPSAVTANNDAGVCTAEVNNIAPISSSDNCSVASITFALTGATVGSGNNDVSGEVFNVGNTTVTYTVTDAQGLIGSCSFDVSVLDSEAPIVSNCPSNITQCDTIVSWLPPTATDNCGIDTINQMQGPSSGSAFPVGTTNISYDIIDNNGNTESCSFTVTVLPPIDSDFWVPDTICLVGAPVDLDDSTNLNLSIPETDMFYSDSSQVEIDANNVLLPQLTGVGTYPIVHVVDNGYCTDTTTYFVTLLPPFQSVFSGLDTLCAAADTFNLASLFNGNTTEGGEFFSPSGANIIQDTLWLLNGSSGIFEIGYTVGIGSCADTTFRQIYLSPDVDPTWQLVSDTICESNPTINLQAFVIGTYNSTSLFTGQGITGNIFEPSGLIGPQVITYHVGEGQCRESLADTLFIIDNPSLDAGPDLEICGDSIQLSGTSNSNITWWSSSNDIAIIDSTLLNGATANLLTNEGEYTVYLNSGNGYCLGKDSLRIRFFTPPAIIDAGPNQVLDYTFNTTFNATPPDYGFGTWKSQSNGVIIDPNNPMSPVDNLEIGENVFYWVVENGVCPKDSSDLIINVKDIFIPEGFSPNGDSRNEFFTIPGVENASSSEIRIFNRWGDELYHSVDYKNDWNGKNQSGQDLPDDTYYYAIIIDERKFSGYIIIRR